MQTNESKKLEQYLSVCQDSYKECIDVIEHSETIKGVNTNLHYPN